MNRVNVKNLQSEEIMITKMASSLSLIARQPRTRKTTKFRQIEPKLLASVKDDASAACSSFVRELPSRGTSFDSVESFHSYLSTDNNSGKDNGTQKISRRTSSARRRGLRRRPETSTTTTSTMPLQQPTSDEKSTTTLPTPLPPPPPPPTQTLIAKMRTRNRMAPMRSKSWDGYEQQKQISSSSLESLITATRQYEPPPCVIPYHKIYVQHQQNRTTTRQYEQPPHVTPYNNNISKGRNQQNQHRRREQQTTPRRRIGRKPSNIALDSHSNNEACHAGKDHALSCNNHTDNNMLPKKQQHPHQQQQPDPPTVTQQYTLFPERRIPSRTHSSPEASFPIRKLPFHRCCRDKTNAPLNSSSPKNDDQSHISNSNNNNNGNKSSNLDNSIELWKPRQVVEILPGVKIPLHGSIETQHAILKDFIQECTCFECDKTLLCVEEATMVVCPLCRSIFPATLDVTAAAAVNGKDNSLGLGMLKIV